MDIDDTGIVDPVQFIVFLSACGPEFELVYNQHKKLPKSERVKLAARRLTNIAMYGEDGVRQLENRLEKRGWAAAARFSGNDDASSGLLARSSRLDATADGNSRPDATADGNSLPDAAAEDSESQRC